MKGMYNYPAGVGDSDFDEQKDYAGAYRECCRERKADGLPFKPFETWLEEYLEEVEDDEQD